MCIFLDQELSFWRIHTTDGIQQRHRHCVEECSSNIVFIREELNHPNNLPLARGHVNKTWCNLTMTHCAVTNNDKDLGKDARDKSRAENSRL